MTTPRTKPVSAAFANAIAEEHGFAIFPVRVFEKDGRLVKVPAIAGGRGHLDASLDSDGRSRLWEKAGGRASIGVNCEMSNLTVADIDGEIEPELGLILLTNDTASPLSVGRGMPHHYYRGTIQGTHNAPGCDIQGIGTYVVLAVDEDHPFPEGAIEPVPQMLIDYTDKYRMSVNSTVSETGHAGAVPHIDLQGWMDSHTERGSDKVVAGFLEVIIDRFDRMVDNGTPRRMAMRDAVFAAGKEAAQGFFGAREAYDRLESHYESIRNLYGDKPYDESRRRDYERMWADIAAKIEAGQFDEEILPDLPELWVPRDTVDPVVVPIRAGTEPVEATEPAPWDPTDLQAILDAGLKPVLPELMPRNDGAPLLYRGKLNVFFGSPEAGKSWVGLLPIGQEVNNAYAEGLDEVVAVFIDYEDSPETYLTRMRAAGFDLDRVVKYTRYISATRPLSSIEELGFMSTARIIVVDTTNAAMTLDDLDPLSNKDALKFMETVKALRRGSEAAWVLIDHEPISSGSERRQAIGAQAKFGAVDGVQMRVVSKGLRPGAEGTINLYVTKDRNGGVRKVSRVVDNGTMHAATIGFVPKGGEGDPFVWEIYAPTGAASEERREKVITEFKKTDWVSISQISELTGIGRDKAKIIVLSLYEDGRLESEKRGTRGVKYRWRSA